MQFVFVQHWSACNGTKSPWGGASSVIYIVNTLFLWWYAGANICFTPLCDLWQREVRIEWTTFFYFPVKVVLYIRASGMATSDAVAAAVVLVAVYVVWYGDSKVVSALRSRRSRRRGPQGGRPHTRVRNL